MNGCVVLSAMPIADKVSRYLQARFLSIQLSALEKAASTIGCEFSQRDCADTMPPEIEKHLTLAVSMARSAYLSPNLPAKHHYETAISQMEDGFACCLFKELVSALEALGMRFRIRESGISWYLLEYEQWKWKTDEGLGKPAAADASAGLPSKHGADDSADAKSLEDFLFPNTDKERRAP